MFERFWSDSRGTFVQYLGASTVDAATPIMALVRFISPTDRRWHSTLEAIETELVEDSLTFTRKAVWPYYEVCGHYYHKIDLFARRGNRSPAGSAGGTVGGVEIGGAPAGDSGRVG